MKKLYTLLFLSLTISGIWAQDEADFYTDYIDLALSKNLVVDYGADGTDETDDSDALQTAIDELTILEHGGRIYIPAGTFYLSKILLRSNIHIEIDKDAIIKPTQDEWEGVVPEDYKNYTIFYMTFKNADITNVSVRSKQEGERFTVDLREVINPRIRVFQLNSVDNFYIADVTIYDAITRFSSITTGTEVHSGMPDNWYAPRNGVIKNMDMYDAHYGYGLIQSQALTNALFKNLYGEGGVTLRLETGYSQMNLQQIGGNFDIVARDIFCENGNAALMVSPHETQNGKVNAANIQAINSGFAVRLASGYTQFQDQGIGPGKYEDVVIDGVKATYGESAQIKSKHFRDMPCELRGLIGDDYNPDGESYPGPAIACVRNTASDEAGGRLTYPNSITNTESIGFVYQEKDVVTTEDADINCLGTYYISYNAGGGEHTNPISYNSEDADLLLLEATKEGYTFVGWFDNANLTDDPITLIAHGSTGDLDLWAKFTMASSVDDNADGVLSVYPNPFDNIIQFELNQNHQFTNLRLLDIAGSVVYQQGLTINQQQLTINTEALQLVKGVYLLQLNGTTGSFRTKVMKK